ncbi:hypothetical protein [Pseudomonas aeruginosa]|uniref:hypothetical protein n=1 Tax=Pseudomonas aeruginosa TaxID=287 RepID=UPI0025528071|nr:hypothetical protein [Pseudomonas aeruginosa]MDK9821639.1 hypothetical protein [Pseudomonas aeruginosa]MDK9827851.1 hypothetical protein [Pseudomonas aeruginosa]HCK5608136.1 hypothetical protein [Pseudomonas aeruginosa]
MKKPLTEQQLSVLKEHSKEGRTHWHSGNVALAEEKFLLAWSTIPEPKREYDYAQSLSRGLVTFYRDVKNHEKAKAWIPVMEEMYGSKSDPSVQFLAATVHFEAEELELAYALFKGLYDSFGKRPFEGEDEKYLEFVKQRAKG